MKKLSLIALATLLTACQSSSLSLTPSPDLSGIFKGTLPCADCEKIEAELTINQDKSYEYYTVYYKKSKEHPFTEKGTYRLDEQQKNVIYLENSGNLAVQIHSDYAELCDSNGKPVGKTEYRLSKLVTK